MNDFIQVKNKGSNSLHWCRPTRYLFPCHQASTFMSRLFEGMFGCTPSVAKPKVRYLCPLLVLAYITATTAVIFLPVLVVILWQGCGLWWPFRSPRRCGAAERQAWQTVATNQTTPQFLSLKNKYHQLSLFPPLNCGGTLIMTILFSSTSANKHHGLGVLL